MVSNREWQDLYDHMQSWRTERAAIMPGYTPDSDQYALALRMQGLVRKEGVLNQPQAEKLTVAVLAFNRQVGYYLSRSQFVTIANNLFNGGPPVTTALPPDLVGQQPTNPTPAPPRDSAPQKDATPWTDGSPAKATPPAKTEPKTTPKAAPATNWFESMTTGQKVGIGVAAVVAVLMIRR